MEKDREESVGFIYPERNNVWPDGWSRPIQVQRKGEWIKSLLCLKQNVMNWTWIWKPLSFAHSGISPGMTLQLSRKVCIKHFKCLLSRCSLNSRFREMQRRPHLENWNPCLLSSHHPVAFSPHSICTNFHWGHFCCKTTTTLKWQQDSTWVKKDDIQNVELSPPSRAGEWHVSIGKRRKSRFKVNSAPWRHMLNLAQSQTHSHIYTHTLSHAHPGTLTHLH